MKQAKADQNDDLGPLLVAPSSYLELRASIRRELGFPRERKPLLIGIDGKDGAGKSSLAAWLSWQHEMAAIHLDLYMVRESNPIAWRLDDLARIIEGQHSLARPLIVEGILLLCALQQVGYMPDFLVFVEKENHESSLAEPVNSYIRSYLPKEKAAHVVPWSSAEYDAHVMRAHHASRL
jgi:hypothetical protein